jgi:hypothetical protein
MKTVTGKHMPQISIGFVFVGQVAEEWINTEKTKNSNFTKIIPISMKY